MNRDKPAVGGILAITDRGVMGMGGLVNAVASAVAGGLPALMLREKDLPEEDYLNVAREIRGLTARAGCRLILNRRPEIARAVGADGVHLGIDGPTLGDVRSRLGPYMLLGYSAHDTNEALAAFDQGADYVIFSPIYETPGKRGILQPVGLQALERLVGLAPGPVIALGGISAANLSDVAATGAAGFAAVRAVFGSGDPGGAVRDLLRDWRAAVGQAGK